MIRRLLIAALVVSGLATVPLTPAGATAEAGNDATCSLGTLGAYQSPEGLVSAYVSGDGGSKVSSPRYRVHASGAPGSTTLTVERLADGEMFGPFSTDSIAWGFSPDQDRFLTASAVGGQGTYRVYDLASATPGTPIHQESIVAGSARIGWSPHGEFFAISVLGGTDTVDLRVYDAVTDAQRLQTTFAFGLTDPGDSDDFQGAGWGFSPDDDEFVYAHAAVAQAVGLRVVDLDAGQQRYQVTLGSDAYWQFSPRGDLLGIVNQTGASEEDVVLVGTHADSDVRASQTYNAIADDDFEATAQGHLYRLGTQTYTLAPLSAPSPDRCPPIWVDATELTASAVSATSVQLSWPGTEEPDLGAADDTAVTGYRVFARVGQTTTQLAELPAGATSYAATGLDPETGYAFGVEAGDAAGHWSTDGPATQVTTLSPPPAWPDGAALTASAVTVTSAQLTWPNLASAGLPLTGYRLYQDGAPIASPSAATTSHHVSGLEPCEDYTFSVQAVWAGEEGESVDGPSTLVTTRTGSPFGCSRVYAEKDGDGHYSGAAEVDGVNWAVSLSWTNVAADHTILSEGEEVPRGGTGLVHYPVEGADTYLSYGWPIYDVFSGEPRYPSLYEPSPGNFYRRSDAPPSADVRVYGGFGAGWSTSFMPIDGQGTIAGVLYQDENANGVRDLGEAGIAGRELFCTAQWVWATSSGNCRVTTGADGAYQLAVNGSVVEFGSGGYDSGPAYLWGNGYDNWFRTSPGKAYAVHDGEAYTGADFGYVHGESSLHGRVFEDLDDDHVRDPGEEGLRVPPPNMQVCVQSRTIPNAHKCDYFEADGDWEVTGLPPGSYDVTVGLGPSGLFDLSVPAAGGYTVTVAANGDDVAVPDFGVHGSYALVAGTVFDDADQDGVRDPGEGPFEGLQICGRVGTGEGSTRNCGSSDSAGGYVLGPFPPGDLTVTGSEGTGYTTPIGDRPGAWSGTVSEGQQVSLDFGVLVACVPKAPTNLTATLGEGYVDLDWDQAVSSQEHPVQGYQVYWYADDYDPVGVGCSTDATTTSCRLAITDPGEPINLVVSAYNDAGSGEGSILRLFDGGDTPGADPSPSSVPSPGPSGASAEQPSPGAAVPSQVTGVRAKVMKHRQILLSWAQTDGATSYLVQRRTDKTTRWRTVKVTSLTKLRATAAGKKVWFRVAALNSVGQGGWSRSIRVRIRP